MSFWSTRNIYEFFLTYRMENENNLNKINIFEFHAAMWKINIWHEDHRYV